MKIYNKNRYQDASEEYKQEKERIYERIRIKTQKTYWEQSNIIRKNTKKFVSKFVWRRQQKSRGKIWRIQQCVKEIKRKMVNWNKYGTNAGTNFVKDEVESFFDFKVYVDDDCQKDRVTGFR